MVGEWGMGSQSDSRILTMEGEWVASLEPIDSPTASVLDPDILTSKEK